MAGLVDLLKPAPLDGAPRDLPAVMAGRIRDVDPLRVTVKAIDGAKHALEAFGTLPDSAAEGDHVRVALDELGGCVILAWEAA